MLATDTEAAAYAELARISLAGRGLNEVLQRVAELAAHVVPGADTVSVTLVERGRARSVAFHGPLAAALDERQYEAGFGPCLDAAATGTLISIDDTADEQVYPDFARQAQRQGIRHTLAVGLAAVHGTGGAINVYSRGADGPLGPPARDAATRFAGYAAVAVTNAAVYAGTLDEIDQMRQAMASRALIEQAKGMIMYVRGCDADEAFDVLRETSNRENRKLSEIAEAFVKEAPTQKAH
jgi:GAF domain-containing protein